MSPGKEASDSPAPAGGAETPAPDSALEDLMAEALSYHEKALSENTRRAYRRGWEDFTEFCEARGFEPLPASEQAVALFLTERARRLSTSTLSQRLAAVQHVHDQRGEESPTRSKAVRAVMRGIRRDSEESPRQAKPLLTADVKRMVDALPAEGGGPESPAGLRAARNKALLLVGYAGAFRRSELAALRAGHLDRRPAGAVVTVPESKTDPEGEGQLVAIRKIEDSEYCPIEALGRWREVAQVQEGPLFRGVRQDGRLRPEAITGRTVSNVVQGAAEAAGLSETDRISGHSLRAGHVTQAAQTGVPDAIVQAQSRHKSDRAFREYVRPQRLLENTSSAHLGL